MAKDQPETGTDLGPSAPRGAGLIGKGIRIKGIVRGKEDLVVEGEVEGSITLPDHHLMLERPSRTSAELRARNATIRGRHRGNAEAIDKIEINSDAVMIGDIKAPRLVIREGARFRGTIDMDVPLPEGLLVEGETPSQGRSGNNKKKKHGSD